MRTRFGSLRLAVSHAGVTRDLVGVDGVTACEGVTNTVEASVAIIEIANNFLSNLNSLDK
jgi:hypothetical protein